MCGPLPLSNANEAGLANSITTSGVGRRGARL